MATERLETCPVQIVRANPRDAGALTAIALAAKRHWGYPERWIESWREALTVRPEFIGAHETYAANIEGRVAGFYALAQRSDRSELVHLWVVPEAMGRGVGRALFSHALQRAKALGSRTMGIESDPNAEGFYLRMGARRAGSSIQQIEHQRRVLPILVYALDASSVNPAPWPGG